MDYLAVGELKQSRKLWERLAKSKEVVLTKDGKPGALMVEVSPENLESVVTAVRRALFSEAVSKARRRARANRPTHRDIENEIRSSRGK